MYMTLSHQFAVCSVRWPNGSTLLLRLDTSAVNMTEDMDSDPFSRINSSVTSHILKTAIDGTFNTVSSNQRTVSSA